MPILAIDPGNTESAYVEIDDNLKPVKFGKVKNDDLLYIIRSSHTDYVVIEMVASYGMPVGKDVFETCVWIGRFWQMAVWCALSVETVTRNEVKNHICHSSKAKDSNIRRELIDKFAKHDFKNGKGTTKNPDWFHGFHDDIWQSYALAVVYHDLHISEVSPC